MRVSVITITFNSENTLRETIESVLSQDYKDLEYIIVDGGSTDGTIDIIRNYEDKISKWISEPDQGISDAFNKGIAMSSGELIGIINSDDMYLHDAISSIVATIDENTDVIHGNMIMFGENRPETLHKQKVPLTHFYKGMAVHHPATFIRARAYKKYGFYNLKYKSSMDRELLLRMYHKGAIFQYIDLCVAKYRRGGTSTKLFHIAQNETREISVKYGMPKYKANIIRLRSMYWFYRNKIILGVLKK
jgi:glycosyltransferase involved in cell wall biosynthesis